MTNEQIKAAIEAEALKRYPKREMTFAAGVILDVNAVYRRGFISDSEWLLSQLPTMGWVKADDVQLLSSVKEKIYLGLSGISVSQNDALSVADSITAIAQAYAAKEAVRFMNWYHESNYEDVGIEKKLWVDYEKEEEGPITTEQLYQQYKQEKDGTTTDS